MNWIFFRRWVSVTTLAEFAGFAVPAAVATAGAATLGPLVRYATLILAGAAEGAILGAGQAYVLQRELPRLSRANWTRRTALAAMLAWAIGMAPSTLSDLVPDLPNWAYIAFLTLLSPVVLCSIGFAQWTELRAHLPGAGRWIAGNIAAWLGGLVIVMGVLAAIADDAPPGVVLAAGILGGFLMGLTVACVNGLVMARMLRAVGEPRFTVSA